MFSFVRILTLHVSLAIEKNITHETPFFKKQVQSFYFYSFSLKARFSQCLWDSQFNVLTLPIAEWVYVHAVMIKKLYIFKRFHLYSASILYNHSPTCKSHQKIEKWISFETELTERLKSQTIWSKLFKIFSFIFFSLKNWKIVVGLCCQTHNMIWFSFVKPTKKGFTLFFFFFYFLCQRSIEVLWVKTMNLLWIGGRWVNIYIVFY